MARTLSSASWFFNRTALIQAKTSGTKNGSCAGVCPSGHSNYDIFAPDFFAIPLVALSIRLESTLIQVQKLIRIQKQQTILRQRLVSIHSRLGLQLVDERDVELDFVVRRLARGRQPNAANDLRT